ncbi:MAG: hypothetical protein ABW120_06450, partial [Sedimenticola sp.]
MRGAIQRVVVTALVVLFLPLGWAQAASSDQEAKMAEVLEVLGELQRIPEESIPPALLENAGAVAVIPNVVKVG